MKFDKIKRKDYKLRVSAKKVIDLKVDPPAKKVKTKPKVKPKKENSPMIIELIGSIKLIMHEEQINDNLSKKEVIITIDENTSYPQDIVVQALNKKIEDILPFKANDRVKVKCYLKGNFSKGRYYNQINLFEITKQ